MAFIIRGMKMPVPTACTSREANSTAKVGATRPPIDPSALHARATNSNVRGPSRRYRAAMAATTNTVTTMNPVTSHCAVMASTENSPMMATSAMFTRFSLKPAIKPPAKNPMRRPAAFRALMKEPTASRLPLLVRSVLGPLEIAGQIIIAFPRYRGNLFGPRIGGTAG